MLKDLNDNKNKEMPLLGECIKFKKVHLNIKTVAPNTVLLRPFHIKKDSSILDAGGQSTSSAVNYFKVLDIAQLQHDEPYFKVGDIVEIDGHGAITTMVSNDSYQLTVEGKNEAIVARCYARAIVSVIDMKFD